MATLLHLLHLNQPILSESPLSILAFIFQQFACYRQNCITSADLEAQAVMIILEQLTALQPHPFLHFLPLSATPLNFLELLTRVYISHADSFPVFFSSA